MDVKIVYPKMKRKHHFWRSVCYIYNVLFSVSLIILPLINIFVGGKPWSLLALVSCFTIWALFIDPGRFELNLPSHIIKALVLSLIIMVIIEMFFKGGWGIVVLPIVSFGGLIVAAILFFSDFERQKHHCLPFLFILLIGFIAGTIGFSINSVDVKWVFITLSAVSLTILIISIIFLKSIIIDNFKKKFNAK